MASQIYDRAGNTKSQPVWKPRVQIPSAFAPNQGAGKRGRPSANTIRKTIRAKLYGTSVAPATDRSRNPKRNTQGFGMQTSTTPPKATRKLSPDSVGSSAGPSANAYDARPRQRKVTRSQIAG